jgi:hypothetical protein
MSMDMGVDKSMNMGLDMDIDVDMDIFERNIVDVVNQTAQISGSSVIKIDLQ